MEMGVLGSTIFSMSSTCQTRTKLYLDDPISAVQALANLPAITLNAVALLISMPHTHTKQMRLITSQQESRAQHPFDGVPTQNPRRHQALTRIYYCWTIVLLFIVLHDVHGNCTLLLLVSL